MSRLGRSALALGAVAVLAGAGLTALGSTAQGSPLPAAVVALTTLAAVTLAVVGLRGIHTGPGDVPRRSVTYGVPGEGLAARLRSLSSTDRATGDTDERRAVRDTVTAVAVDALADSTGVSREDARRQIAAGDWTDDDSATAFFAGDLLPERSVADVVRELLTGETVFARRAARAVDALYGLRWPVPDPGRTGETADPDPSVVAVAETDRSTRRWRPVALFALAAAGVGAAGGRPALVLSGALGLAFVAYGHSGNEEAPELAVERTVEAERPAPGETVDVEVAVRNAAGRFLPQVHLVDPVPPGLTVVEGSAETTAALRAGDEVGFAYAVRTARGAHEFDGPVAVTRDLAGARERVRRLDGDGTLICVPPLSYGPSVGVRPRDALRIGHSRTPRAGAGLEFHSVREFVPGDPLSRVGWRGLARSGDLRTVQFHRERSVSIVVVVDARRSAYCAPEPGGPPAVERCVRATRSLAGSLLADGHRVGVAALSPVNCWLAPGLGSDHRDALRRLLGTHPALSWTPPDGDDDRRRWLRERVGSADSVVLVSPLRDDDAARVARNLDALGLETAVVAPDPTATDTPARRFARLERRARVRTLRRAGLPVVDWPRGESLAAALRRGTGR